jgi:hypothetical protein
VATLNPYSFDRCFYFARKPSFSPDLRPLRDLSRAAQRTSGGTAAARVGSLPGLKLETDRLPYSPPPAVIDSVIKKAVCK